MTQRERVMALGVGALVVLIVGYFGLSSLFSFYQSKQDAISSKERELNEAKLSLLEAENQVKLLAKLTPRSLPGNPNDAVNEYKRWLQTSLRDANVFPDNVAVGPNFFEKGEEYAKLKSDIRASARLDDLTNWLNEFYAINALHRVKNIKLTPIDNSRLLSVQMELETIALTKAKLADSKFKEYRATPGQTKADLDAQLEAERQRLQKSIAGRNPFGPPNSEPILQPIGKVEGVIGKQMEVIVKGKDKRDGSSENDDDALLLYRLVDANITDYTFDDVKGILRWTPRTKGEFKATVEVADDGIPRKTSRQSFAIVVKDPPKIPDVVKPKDPPKPTFDVAKWAFVTAIVQEEGAGEVWINERSTGKSQKLKLGDDVKYGAVSGKITRIDSSGIEVEAEGAKFFTKVGQSLGVAASNAGAKAGSK